MAARSSAETTAAAVDAGGFGTSGGKPAADTVDGDVGSPLARSVIRSIACAEAPK
ncbi:MAG TPA: hypothetical protein VMV69_30385 [Pirellulales bacterium]|nr:hypothetical protein [Pirellulales bacterium]